MMNANHRSETFHSLGKNLSDRHDSAKWFPSEEPPYG